MLLNKLMKD
jgi:hypothetical protein